jgi:osmotically-inducible protein OsmY
MFPTSLPIIHTDEFSRCEERGQITGPGKVHQNDPVMKDVIYQALWKDDVLRAIDYYEIDVQAKDEIVYLFGHIIGTGSQLRILNAIGKIPGILGIKNHLVLDDKLTLDVASSLGELEHTYDCKFFTGASHGVIAINGTVSDHNIKSLAEKCVASNSSVRGVINNVCVLEVDPEAREQPFLQPAIGEIIYFSDGLSGVVKQVVMNPNNRRVIAMTVQGKFREQQNILHPLSDGKVKPIEQLIVLPMKVVRYLTKDSGFLHIKSDERNQYQDFDSTSFYAPNWDWTPPYPYCPDDVLFPVEYRVTDNDETYQPQQILHEETLSDTSFKEKILANNSLGGKQ